MRCVKPRLPLSRRTLITSLMGLVFFASIFLLIYQAKAQTATSPPNNTTSTGASAVAISTDSGGVLAPPKQDNRFARVGIKPGQVATITLQYPLAMAGQVFQATGLDGGKVIISSDSLTINQSGQLTFEFQAGNAVGHYRVMVYQGDFAQTLQFWVRDLSNPKNNPPLFPGS